MKSNVTMPFVSVVMTTYNRKRYVKAALEGIFSQTYELLEIVISDDCSTDGTWEIVNDIVRKYRERDGARRVVLNRNEMNLGVVANFEKLVSLCQGELIIQCGDDDISLPNRVEVIVSAWVNGGKRAKLIHNGAIIINENGRVMRKKLGKLDAFNPRGATASYAADIFGVFPKIEMLNAFEDRPYAARAALLGDEIYIPDKLVKYRIGNSATSSTRNFRWDVARGLERSIAGCDQSLIDIDLWHDKIGDCRYEEFRKRCLDARHELSRFHDILVGKTVKIRWRNRVRFLPLIGLIFRGHLGNALFLVRQILCIIPMSIGTPLLNRYVRLLYAMGY